MVFCLSGGKGTYFFFVLFQVAFSAVFQDDVPLTAMAEVGDVFDDVFVTQTVHDFDFFADHLGLLC